MLRPFKGLRSHAYLLVFIIVKLVLFVLTRAAFSLQARPKNNLEAKDMRDFLIFMKFLREQTRNSTYLPVKRVLSHLNTKGIRLMGKLIFCHACDVIISSLSFLLLLISKLSTYETKRRKKYFNCRYSLFFVVVVFPILSFMERLRA